MRGFIGVFLAIACPLLALEPPSQSRPSLWPRPSPQPTIQQELDKRPFTNNPTGGGLSVEGAEELLRSGITLTITFPTPMVSPDRIDVEGSESPIEISPSLDIDFTWRTQMQGELMVKAPLIPGESYRFRLRQGTRDLNGEPLPEAAWGFEMTTPPLRVVEEGYGARDNLNASPQIPLEFNYPVRLADAANCVWFQDRITREKFPAEILLNYAEGEMDDALVVEVKETRNDVTAVRVRPLQPLPVGRRYDLVVDGICDAYGGRSLRYPQVFPIGTTRSLQIDYVAARNFPLETPRVEVKFSQALGDIELPADALKISPAVTRLNIRKDGALLIAEGDFKPNSRYSVTVSEKILGTTGYGLAKSQTWGASFRPRESAILFPAQQIRQRSLLGVKFAFYQVNTSAVEWKLADVPLDKLPSVLSREREFEKTLTDAKGGRVWTKEGTFQRQSSQPLIAELGLSVIASGEVPAAGEDKEILREIVWKPEDSTTLTGAKLLEVTGRDFEGKVIGNRALIYFGEIALTRKLTKSHSIIRAASLSDGKPVAKSVLTALDKDLQEIARLPTDENGLATFDVLTAALAKYFLCEGTLQPVALSDQFSGGSLSARPPPRLRAYTLVDRPLYRPGQSIQFKGFVREDHAGTLKIPVERAVKWTIERAYASEVLASGESRLDAEGSWNGSWTPPTDSPVGEFVLKAMIGGQATAPARFQIQEFRNPPFSVICENLAAKKPAESVISVQSQYFHGAPNARSVVKWTATWVSDSTDGEYDGGDDDWRRIDSYSEHAKAPEFTAETSGEAVLDGAGSVVLRSEAPFKDPGNRARCQVIWRVDVTGPDAQTITGGTTQDVAMAPVLLGIKRGESEAGKVQFFWNAQEAFGTAPEAVNVQLFHVQTKSVKERLAPNVYRYRNFDHYELLEERQQVTEDSLEFTPGKPGRYVALIAPVAGAPGFPVSEEAYLAGDEASEVPVQSDTTATVFSVKAGTRENARPWLVGEKAVLNVLAPSGGIAWVSVETDKVLDTFTTPLDGNTSRIEIPIKPEYEPNVFVSVYLLRPGGSDQLAGEMYGYDQVPVQALDRALEISVRTNRPEYEPGEKVSGEVTVKAAGRPVAGADLVIYAVDDSILTLGGWSLPRMLVDFFPARPFAVVTYSALKAYVDKIAPSWLTMKGFVAGDAGTEQFGNVAFTRKEFKPLILWRPSVRTSAKGVAKFECDAPDNLTRFRVIAVGQTRNNQFGAGDTTFAVSKKLLVDPALPRFLREGDQVDLRAVARQKVSESEKLTMRCTVGGGLELNGAAQQEVSVARDTPTVVRFRARASSTGWANVKFEAKSAGKLMDAVEVTVPVADPAIPQKESVSGSVTGTTLSTRELMLPGWSQGRGSFNLAISTTPWLDKLMGLPFLLDYPHGCFEQKSSRLLGYTLLGGLLEYLPEVQAREASYQHVIRETLREFETGLLPDGRMPYWAGGTEPNDFVTIQTAWCVNQAEQAGFDVPERLSTELAGALEKMVSAQTALSPTLRAFALFVLSQAGDESPDIAASAAMELFLQRDKLTGEGKAMLAIAMHYLGLEQDKQRVLISELPSDFSAISFNPETFASGTRTEALCGWAKLLVDPEKSGNAIRDRLLKLTLSSASLSTQENLWLLVTFQAMIKATPLAQLAGSNPSPETLSDNGTAGSWGKQDLARLTDFSVTGLQPGGSFVLKADYRPSDKEAVRVTRGLAIDRVTRNLTDASRDGSDRAPFQLGDQILISYRISSEKPQSYVVVEDALPAGLEVVNPNLDLFGKFYALPAEAASETADLSHSEMRDQQTNLYFDELPAGTRSYSVLARATAAGSFVWPTTQISPMYDSRFVGRSASSQCHVAAP
jgi:alpha-2-macroglobulin